MCTGVATSNVSQTDLPPKTNGVAKSEEVTSTASEGDDTMDYFSKLADDD